MFLWHSGLRTHLSRGRCPGPRPAPSAAASAAAAAGAAGAFGVGGGGGGGPGAGPYAAPPGGPSPLGAAAPAGGHAAALGGPPPPAALQSGPPAAWGGPPSLAAPASSLQFLPLSGPLAGGGGGGGGGGGDGNNNNAGDNNNPGDEDGGDNPDDDPDDPDDPDYADEDDDSSDGGAGVSYAPSYQNPFTPAAARRARFTRPAIHGFLLPPRVSGPRLLPAPFDVVGDTQYERLAGRVHGKASAELEFTYNVCAWLQALQNRALVAELEAEADDLPVSRFDVDIRVALHQLFVLTSARYKVLDLAVTDATQSATLHALVTRHNRPDQYCPAFDFLATAQDEQLVRAAARQHGRRAAAEIRGAGGGGGRAGGEGGGGGGGGGNGGGGGGGPRKDKTKKQRPGRRA